MNKWLFPGLTLGLIVLTAVFLSRWKERQRLGDPGIKVAEVDDSGKLEILFPETVLDYTSKEVPFDVGTVNALPADTTLGRREYFGRDGFRTYLIGVMMGTDRTSIHKPQFCLTGGGFDIKETLKDTIRVQADEPYDVPVTVLRSVKEINGIQYTGFYIYWFVADGLITAEHWERMWWMAGGLLRTGELQRWAYVSCLSLCVPSREEITLVRMKSFLEHAIPHFQYPPDLRASVAKDDGVELAGVLEGERAGEISLP